MKITTCLVALGICLSVYSIQAAPGSTMSRHIPAEVRGLTPLGTLDDSQQMDLTFSLPLRNQAELDRTLAEIYDPASPRFHHYLSPAEFTERFGPSEADYAALIDFARNNGFTIRGMHANRMLIGVRGSVATIRNALHTRILRYRHPKEQRTCFAPESEPSLDLAMPILRIRGLDDFARPRPHARRTLLPESSTGAVPQWGTGTGQWGTYIGADFRNAYAAGVTETGAGQSIALVEFDGYHPGDITNYLNQANLAPVRLVNKLLDNFDGTPGVNNDEVALDIEVAIAMAPGLQQITVYEAGASGDPNELLNLIATENEARQISCSWTWGTYKDPTTSQIFQQFASQGQSFFTAAGDSDAYASVVATPADDPYVTCVGGTTLLTSTDTQSWSSEQVWNWGGDLGTGGGVSTSYPLPAWQAGVATPLNQGSSVWRNIPDVALTADGVQIVADNGTNYSIGGTSVAAPLWAAFAALINQRATVHGLPPVGFINPGIYALGKSCPGAFHDISLGSNTNSSSPTKYQATPGYDLCTGWGTPVGTKTIDAILGIRDTNISSFRWEAPQGCTAGVPFSVTLTAVSSDGTAAAFTGPALLDASSWSTNVNFSWDFESGTISDWTNEGGTYTRAIDTNGAEGTSHSLTLIGGNWASSYSGISHALSNCIPSEVSFFVRKREASKTGGCFVVGTAKYLANSVVYFMMDASGVMGLFDGNAVIHGTNYNAEQWYKVRVALDWTHKRSDLYIDGILMAQGVPFPNGSATSTSVLNLFNLDNTQVWWDQIQFSSASRSTVPLTPTNTGTFTNGVWTGNLLLPGGLTSVILTATDGAGHTGSSSPLGVQFAYQPTVLQDPDSQTVNPGQDATFTVVATNQTSYQWLRDSVAISNATNASYTLSGAKDSDSGTLFSCQLQNSVGTVTTRSAKLTVRPTIQASGARNPDGTFRFQIAGTSGTNYVIQASTDLQNWTTIGAVIPTEGAAIFTDTGSAGFPLRFYRLLAP